MITSKTEKCLKGIGLNSYEVRIWVALLSRGVSTAGELTDVANVPRSRSYDVLESLRIKGFVVIKPGKPTKYSATQPQLAIDKVKTNITIGAEKEIIKLDKLEDKKLVKELAILHNRGLEATGSSELSGMLRGRINIYNHVEFMMKRAEKSILIATSETEFINIISRFGHLFKKLKSKNVNIKFLTQFSNKTEKLAQKIKNFVGVNYINNKSRLIVVDGKEIIFMVMDENEVHPSYDIGIWTNSQLAKDFEKIFPN